MTQGIEGEYPISQVVVFQLLKIAESAVQLAPPTILMATLFTLVQLSRTNELVACYSIGIGLRNIVAVILSIVFAFSSLLLVIQDRILPPLNKKRSVYFWHVMKNRPDFSLDLKKDKVWYRSKNQIYNLRSFDPKTQKIYGMTIYTFDSGFNLQQIIRGNSAEYAENRWKLSDGNVTVFAPPERIPMTQPFRNKEVVLTERPQDFAEIEKEVEGLRLKDLLSYIRKIKEAGADTKSYEVKFHSKISLSFIPLVMSVLAVPFATRRRREGGVGKDIGLCLLITFFYWLSYSLSLSMGTNGAAPPIIAAWFPTLCFAGIAGFLLIRKKTA